YSPLLFAGAWMKAIGKTPQQLNKDVAKYGYGLALAAGFALACFLGQAIKWTGAVTVGEALRVALWAWVGFILPAVIPDYFFAGRKKSLLAINMGYPLISMLAMSVILTLWR
ncbi:MAG: DUF1761 domain-containing protein, partial [Bdellovibrionota bacterium]